MPENQELVSLSMAPSTIKKETGKAVPGGYSKLYSLILRGEISAEKVGSRWFIDRAEFPAIIGLLAA